MKKSAILVLSCDKYSSLWKPFFVQFHKYWPACRYPLYLGSNTIVYGGDKNVQTLLSGKSKDWSTNFLSILDQIPEEYIFVWLEDYFLTNYLDQKLFDSCLRFLISQKANHIQMTPSIPSDEVSKDGMFACAKKGAPYRAAAYGFWKKNHLQKIILPGENVWQFETFGSYRSSFFDGYFSLRRNLFEYIQIVERGKIFREAYEYCIKHNINLDMSDWQVHSRLHKVKSDIMRHIFNGIIRIPWKARVGTMNIFRKALASY